MNQNIAISLIGYFETLHIMNHKLIILCGDVGLGFTPKLEEQKLSELKKICEKQNCVIF